MQIKNLQACQPSTSLLASMDAKLMLIKCIHELDRIYPQILRF